MRAAVLPAVLLAVLAASLPVVAGCGDNLHGSITVVTDPRWEPALRELVTLTPFSDLALVTALPASPAEGFQVVVTDDPTIPAEGYQLDAPVTGAAGEVLAVHAHDVLGAQYGVAAALEGLGFRFRHPFDPLVPTLPKLGVIDTAVHSPAVRVRGFQLHTLHPIEGYFAFWEAGDDATDAHRIIDWVVKNRGNYLQWVALDNIMDPAQHAAWQAATRELVDYAHLRGIRVGLGLQLFGQSNLQSAFDLSDDKTGTVPIHDEIAARLPLVTRDLPFDVYAISFGEFFNAEPQRFIDSVNEVQRQLATIAPAAEMHALVHVGAEQRIEYMGESLIYYFLVKFADAAIIPDVHTVMFYNLFEPTGGAYQHTDFSEHRAYLQQRMCAGSKGSYMPETAYWVAFDNSVPQFFPLYVQSRLRDLTELQRPEGPCGKLDEHLLFSSGWEWGYWLNDVTSLRGTYELPTSSLDAISAELAPDLGARAAELVDLLANAQHQRVMLDQLTGYLVGRDSVIDAGRTLHIISQPDRVTFDQLAAGTGRASVDAMLPTLRAYIDEVAPLVAELDALDLPLSRWTSELRDGFHVDLLRARFVLATYEATLAHLDGDAPTATARYREAAELVASAHSVVRSRHADLHDDHGRRLVDKTANQTFYQFGYLYFAESLCYWERELVQVGGVLGSTSQIPPSCFY